MPLLLAAKAAGQETRRPLTTGKSVIFVMMHGGPSQFETWDPKQDGPANGRSASGVVQTSIPGVHFGATFPRLARHANKLAIVRNYQAENGNHDIKPVVSPYSLNANLGSLYARVVGSLRPNGMPTNVALFPNSVDPRGPGMRNNFGNFLSTGSLGRGFFPFVPGRGRPDAAEHDAEPEPGTPRRPPGPAGPDRYPAPPGRCFGCDGRRGPLSRPGP